MTEKRQWPKPGVRLTEVSVKTELTVKHRSTFSNSHNKTKSNRVLHTRVFPRCIFPCSYDCFIQSTSHCVLWLVIENITRLKTALWLSSSFWTEIISFLDNACVCVYFLLVCFLVFVIQCFVNCYKLQNQFPWNFLQCFKKQYNQLSPWRHLATTHTRYRQCPTSGKSKVQKFEMNSPLLRCLVIRDTSSRYVPMVCAVTGVDFNCRIFMIGGG